MSNHFFMECTQKMLFRLHCHILKETKFFVFRNNFILWLDNWKSLNYDVGCLSKETHKALGFATHCLLELAAYCTQEFNLQFILPGKFQTDDLVARFGFYRQLCGSQYNISAKQVYEAEPKLRLHSVLKFSASKKGF